MKKIIFSLTLILASITLVKAQDGDPYEKGSNVIQAGIGLGGGFYTGSVSLPLIQGRYEYGLTDNISIGGIIGYSSSNYNYGFGKYGYNYLLVAARGNYHLDVNVDNLDLYGGLTLGYNSVTFKDKGNNLGGYNAKGSSGLFGAQIGANYYFQPNIGAWAEVGAGLGLLNLGVTFKF